MKKLKGVLTGDKMTKTATVKVSGWRVHPLYKKRFRREKNYHAENLIDARIGDKVEIVETRPLSKTKRWRITKII